MPDNAKTPAVYLLTNKANGTLYIGVTSDLLQRIWQHKHQVVDGFTKKYKLHRLVYYEIHESILDAIEREKQLKGWLRIKKIQLIEAFNPEWKDLYEEIV